LVPRQQPTAVVGQERQYIVLEPCDVAGASGVLPQQDAKAQRHVAILSYRPYSPSGSDALDHDSYRVHRVVAQHLAVRCLKAHLSTLPRTTNQLDRRPRLPYRRLTFITSESRDTAVPSHQGAQAPAADAPGYRGASAVDVDAIARLHALHVLPDSDARWGALVDHLHVSAALKRHGVGTRLLVEAARELARRPTHGASYLWVLDQNKAAQAFYAARGRVRMQTTIRGPFPGAGTARGHRVAWTNPTHHLAQRAWRGRGLSRRRRTTRVRRRTIG
ncbi:MAG: hypothetical protein QOC73_1619, partial [Actinomycetota bacterium]|nr:hypothetical protein [Actinomycetota bacterium]